MRAEIREELRVGLEKLLRVVDRPTARPAAVGTVDLTTTYGMLLVACSFARLGERLRATTLMDTKRTAYGARIANDPVHAWLFAAFEARIAAIVEGRASEAWLPSSMRGALDGLDRVARYRVDSFRAALPFPDAPVDPIAAFARRERPVLPEVPAWEALAENERVERAAQIIDDLGDLASCLAILRTLPEARALPILVRAIPLTRQDPDAAASALDVVAHFGWGELAGGLVATVRQNLDRTRFETAVRALRRLGLRDDLAALIDAFVVDDDEAFALIIAGARVFLGDPRATAIFEATHEKLFSYRGGSGPMVARVRRLAYGYALADVTFALSGVERTGWLLKTIGTGGHFDVSFIHIVASLCLIIDELR